MNRHKSDRLSILAVSQIEYPTIVSEDIYFYLRRNTRYNVSVAIDE